MDKIAPAVTANTYELGSQPLRLRRWLHNQLDLSCVRVSSFMSERVCARERARARENVRVGVRVHVSPPSRHSHRPTSLRRPCSPHAHESSTYAACVHAWACAGESLYVFVSACVCVCV